MYTLELRVHIIWKCAWFSRYVQPDNITSSTPSMVDDAAINDEDNEIWKKNVGEPKWLYKKMVSRTPICHVSRRAHWFLAASLQVKKKKKIYIFFFLHVQWYLILPCTGLNHLVKCFSFYLLQALTASGTVSADKLKSIYRPIETLVRISCWLHCSKRGEKSPFIIFKKLGEESPSRRLSARALSLAHAHGATDFTSLFRAWPSFHFCVMCGFRFICVMRF